MTTDGWPPPTLPAPWNLVVAFAWGMLSETAAANRILLLFICLVGVAAIAAGLPKHEQ